MLPPYQSLHYYICARNTDVSHPLEIALLYCKKWKSNIDFEACYLSPSYIYIYIYFESNLYKFLYMHLGIIDGSIITYFLNYMYCLKFLRGSTCWLMPQSRKWKIENKLQSFNQKWIIPTDQNSILTPDKVHYHKKHVILKHVHFIMLDECLPCTS